MKKVIGILPEGKLFDPEKGSISDNYRLGNNYVKCMAEAGAIPVCLAPVDGYLSREQLEMCDGFLVQGGMYTWPYHFQTVHHAVTTGKRYLGICGGMQMIQKYYILRNMAAERNMEGEVDENVIRLFFEQGEGRNLLQRVEGHNLTGITREDTDCIKHDVNIVEGTVLHRLMGRTKLRAASTHDWRTEYPAEGLTVNAWADDETDTIEGFENGDNLLGVQFHPEVDGLLPEIFRFLTEG